MVSETAGNLENRSVKEVRIAHFSDAHVLSLTGVTPRQFLNKRWAGGVNLLFNRSRHYRIETFELLLKAIVAVRPTHTICSGDLANLALPSEFEAVARLLHNCFSPDDLTLVPGNHDYYAKPAVKEGLFERLLHNWLPHQLDCQSPSMYPVTRLLSGVLIVGLNSAILTPVFNNSGRIGPDQLTTMRTMLSHEVGRGRFRLLFVHHALLPRRYFFRTPRSLLDGTEFIQALHACRESQPHLVVHGHNHYFLRQKVPGMEIPLVQVASASRTGHPKKRAEFNIYVVREGALWAIERHIHDPATGAFVPCTEAGNPIEVTVPR